VEDIALPDAEAASARCSSCSTAAADVQLLPHAGTNAAPALTLPQIARCLWSKVRTSVTGRYGARLLLRRAHRTLAPCTAAIERLNPSTYPDTSCGPGGDRVFLSWCGPDSGASWLYALSSPPLVPCK